MRVVAVICAILAVCLAGPAGAQSYPYLATLPVADLIAQTPENEPQDLAFDATGNRLLIAEGPNQVVQIVDGTSFTLLATLGVAGVSGSDAGHFSNPGGVAIDPASNRILVADTGNDRVQLFDATSFALVGTLGQTGTPGADNAHLSNPTGVAIDSANGRILVADTGNDRVQLFDANSLALIGTIGVAGTPGADNGHLSAPQAAVLDPASGYLLVADTGNGRIQVFDAQSAAYLGDDRFDRQHHQSRSRCRRAPPPMPMNPTAYDVVVIDADALATVSTSRA